MKRLFRDLNVLSAAGRTLKIIEWMRIIIAGAAVIFAAFEVISALAERKSPALPSGE